MIESTKVVTELILQAQLHNNEITMGCYENPKTNLEIFAGTGTKRQNVAVNVTDVFHFGVGDIGSLPRDNGLVVAIAPSWIEPPDQPLSSSTRAHRDDPGCTPGSWLSGKGGGGG